MVLPREELTAPLVHLALGLEVPLLSPVICCHVRTMPAPGGVNCAGESLPRAKPGAFVTPPPMCCRFALCQGSWARLEVLPSSQHFPPLLPSSSDLCRQTERIRSQGRSKVSCPSPCAQACPSSPMGAAGQKGNPEQQGGRARLTQQRVVSVLWCQAMKEAALARQRCLATAWI